jgi:hypothetical protein
VRIDDKLQHLAKLMGLRDLRLKHLWNMFTIESSTLADAQELTRLELCGVSRNAPTCEPGMLAGKTRLKHLSLGCYIPKAAGSVAELLSQLQQLTQLEQLYISRPLHQLGPAVAAYSALAASTQMRDLNVIGDAPAGVRQHILPSGRKLPQLKQLVMALKAPGGAGDQQQPFGLARVVSSCPALQELHLNGGYTPELLVPLTALTALSKLSASIVEGTRLGVLAQLTNLRDLRLTAHGSSSSIDTGEQRLLPLTELKQLTHRSARLGGDRGYAQYELVSHWQ